MKKILSISLTAIVLTILNFDLAVGQDMDINILAVPGRIVQGQTGGRIQVQVCNFEFPGGISLPANRVIPQISLPSALVTTVNLASGASDWTVLAADPANPTVIRVTNTNPIPPETCLTFTIGYTAQNVGGPSNVVGSLTWNGPQPTENFADNDNGTTSIQVIDRALPVTLTSFSVDEYAKGNLLDWKIKNESGFSHFSIRKSLDLNEFWEIGTTKGGNKSGKYEYLDTDFEEGINYYQLKMVDKDGSFEYSKIISIENKGQFGSTTVYPNPSPNRVYNLKNVEDFKEINLLSMDGSIYSVDARKFDGRYEIKVPEQYTAGTYILQFINDERIIRKKTVLE